MNPQPITVRPLLKVKYEIGKLFLLLEGVEYEVDIPLDEKLNTSHLLLDLILNQSEQLEDLYLYGLLMLDLRDESLVKKGKVGISLFGVIMIL